MKPIRHLRLILWGLVALVGLCFAVAAVETGHNWLSWLGAAPLLGMAVTANQLITGQDIGRRRSIPVLAAKTLYQGSLVFLERTSGADEGYATDISDSGANDFIGIAVEKVDNSAGASGAKNVEVYTEGTYELTGTGFEQGHVGDLVYASDNYTLTLTAEGNSRVGRIEEYISATKVAVKLDPVA